MVARSLARRGRCARRSVVRRRALSGVAVSRLRHFDIGAGHGVFLEELKAARGIEGVGIEITPAKVDYARARGIDLRIGDAASLARYLGVLLIIGGVVVLKLTH